MAIYEASLDELRETRRRSRRRPTRRVLGRDVGGRRGAPAGGHVHPGGQPADPARSYDVTFAGADGDPIRAWLHLPAGRPPTPRPGVVEFYRLRRRARPGAPERPVGRGPGRPPGHGHPRAGLGLVRPATPPTRTARRRPIRAFSLEGCSTRRSTTTAVFGDAVRASRRPRSHPAVDADRIVAVGGSQGGRHRPGRGGAQPARARDNAPTYRSSAIYSRPV